jgi:hypothetical protein
VFFLLFGAGKTAALDALAGHIPGLATHDFDEIGVPKGADAAWRQRSNEVWVRRALQYQDEGTDLLLAGQTPFGALLATPSAPLLEALSACLIDCDDETRIMRLRARGPEWLDAAALRNHLGWARWMRRHAQDPAWRVDVIKRADPAGAMRWERWSDWQVGDPRWRVHVIDSSRLQAGQVADEVTRWIAQGRADLRAGAHLPQHRADDAKRRPR